jgi:hypothetical protein
VYPLIILASLGTILFISLIISLTMMVIEYRELVRLLKIKEKINKLTKGKNYEREN